MTGAHPLVVTLEGRDHVLQPDGRPVLLGADPAAPLRTAHGPRRWLTLRYAAGWTIAPAPGEESGSLDVDGAARLVRLSAERSVVRLDGPGSALLRLRHGADSLEVGLRVPSPGSATAPATVPAPRSARHGSGTRLDPGARTTIGRTGQGAQVQVGGEDVAAVHAEVRWDGARLVVRDLQQGTGTFVDGQAVLRAPVAPGQPFVIGHHEFRVDPEGLLTSTSLAGTTGLHVDGVAVRYPGAPAPAVRGIAFALPERSLLAVLGPSGIGKSTLCAALLGEAAVVEGSAGLGDLPLGDGPPSPSLVSFVPQGSPLMAELTVQEVLDHAARLRLASDLDDAERRGRIDDVLDRLEMRQHAHQPVGKLSGGQVRRVSIAVELLARPVLLMLDEPTSGLDEGLDRLVMKDLRSLADEGTTVVVVTHSTAHLSLATHLLAVARGPALPDGGRPPSVMGYFGPPERLLDDFGVTEHADVMDALRESHLPPPGAPDPAAQALDAPTASRTAPASVPLRRSLAVSARRERRRMELRWRSLLGLAVLGPLLVGTIAAFTSAEGLGGTPTDPNRQLATSLAVVTICVSFLAMALSVTAVVGDLPVIDRERRWGVRPASAVLSRVVVRVVVAVVQAALAGVALTVLRPAPTRVLGGVPGVLGVVVLLAALTVTCTCLGVLVSALCTTTEQAVGLMSGSLAAMVILSGLVIPLGDSTGFVRGLSVASYLTPTRWATASVLSFIDGPAVAPLSPDAMWQHDAAHVLLPLLVLAVGCAVVVATAVAVLPRTLARAGRR